MTERLVVVGGGLAGVQTVAALRQQGYSGDLVLVGAEREPPYDRPPLSKQWLLAGGGDEPEVTARSVTSYRSAWWVVCS